MEWASTFVGLDVHKETIDVTIVAHTLPPGFPSGDAVLSDHRPQARTPAEANAVRPLRTYRVLKSGIKRAHRSAIAGQERLEEIQRRAAGRTKKRTLNDRQRSRAV